MNVLMYERRLANRKKVFESINILFHVYKDIRATVPKHIINTSLGSVQKSLSYSMKVRRLTMISKETSTQQSTKKVDTSNHNQL